MSFRVRQAALHTGLDALDSRRKYLAQGIRRADGPDQDDADEVEMKSQLARHDGAH